MRRAAAGESVSSVTLIILAAVGVPLWFCAVAAFVLAFRNRKLRKRPGNISVRMRRAPGKRWVRGHAIWLHDVFAFRGSPAAWSEQLAWVSGTALREATGDETKGAKGIHGLGDAPVIATFDVEGGGPFEVAVSAEDRPLLVAGSSVLVPVV
jgi:hypothetical protein